MLRSTVFFCLLSCCITRNGMAQQSPATIDTLLTGTWKGSSICQIKSSPCHDETVVYHISKKSGVDTFYINACKIVNGVEEEMGILPFVYQPKTNRIVSTAYGIWTFSLKGPAMEGTLYVQGDLYRKIGVRKQYQP